MQNIFDNPSQLESIVKQTFAVPDFLMMENAALTLAEVVFSNGVSPDSECVILCGKGNNGGDGYALARLLQNQLNVYLFCVEEPAAAEAKVQFTMCQKLGIPFLSEEQLFDFFAKKSFDSKIIVDCIYGTGFKGILENNVQKIINAANECNAYRVACDIPSGLSDESDVCFNADCTVTMGEHKLKLFSDKAKAFCGTIEVANLGIANELFEKCMEPCAHLIEQDDIILPFRTNRRAHKGTYGHTAVYAGEKSGAAIIGATAALNFGTGLCSLIKTSWSNLEQFKISPQLMICNSLPAKTSCVVLGSGFGINQKCPQELIEWFMNTENPSVVFDADCFSNKDFIPVLEKLSSVENARIILTPHLSETQKFLASLNYKIDINQLSDNAEEKIKAGKYILQKFPNVTLVMKSANTFIFSNEDVFVITQGTPALAKGGSGDILAGMIGALLAQGYSSQNAAITACQVHAQCSSGLGPEAFNMTPEKLLEMIRLG